jgi:hypothetical protein
MTATDDSDFSDDEELVTQFVEWTGEAVVEIRTIVDTMDEKTLRSSASIDRFYDLSHNIKGMGSSFNFDLMTDVGTSACVYLKNMAGDALVSKRVLDAHARIYEVVLAHRITGDGGEKGAALSQRLQGIIAEEA